MTGSTHIYLFTPAYLEIQASHSLIYPS